MPWLSGCGIDRRVASKSRIEMRVRPICSRSLKRLIGESLRVETVGVEPRKSPHHQQFAQNRLAQAQKNPSNRWIEVHKKYVYLIRRLDAVRPFRRFKSGPATNPF